MQDADDRMEEGLASSLNPVLGSVEPVIARSRHVRTNEERVREVARAVTDDQLGLDERSWWRQPVFIKEDSARTIDFFMIGNALNFKYWDSEEPGTKYACEYKGVTWDGAFGMWAALSRALDEGRPVLDARYLADLTDEEAAEIFRGTSPMPMVRERAAILREVGRVLEERYGGSFANLVERAGRRAFDDGNGIVERLVRDLPSYGDASSYDGHEVVFNKRAQLAVGMLYRRLSGTGLFDVDDIDSLTVFADYQLPKALRSLGVIEYSEGLAEKVDARQLIEKGSQEEVEIRAHTVYASDLLLKEVNAARAAEGKGPVNALNIDYYLWRAGRDAPEGYHHLTETTAY